MTHKHGPPVYKGDCVDCVVNLLLEHISVNRSYARGIWQWYTRTKPKEFMDEVKAKFEQVKNEAG